MAEEEDVPSHMQLIQQYRKERKEYEQKLKQSIGIIVVLLIIFFFIKFVSPDHDI